MAAGSRESSSGIGESAARTGAVSSLCRWREPSLFAADDFGKLWSRGSGPTGGRIRGYAFPADRRRQWKSFRIGHGESERHTFFQCHRDRNLYRRFWLLLYCNLVGLAWQYQQLLGRDWSKWV